MKRILLLLLLSGLLAGCQSQKSDEPQTSPAATAEKITKLDPAPAQPAEPKVQEAQKIPPTPPLFEDFQARPQLSLFPRAGAYRPEDDDTTGLQYWRTYIEHLMHTSGPVKIDAAKEPNFAFSFRAIKGLDSVGVFSPIEVKPDTRYEVAADITYQLVAGASAGIGLLEFDQFLWIGEQYPESLCKEHQVGTQTGVTLSGTGKNQAEHFTFTSGPKTHMVHLIFFRDGENDRNQVIIDNIAVKEVDPK